MVDDTCRAIDAEAASQTPSATSLSSAISSISTQQSAMTASKSTASLLLSTGSSIPHISLFQGTGSNIPTRTETSPVETRRTGGSLQSRATSSTNIRTSSTTSVASVVSKVVESAGTPLSLTLSLFSTHSKTASHAHTTCLPGYSCDVRTRVTSSPTSTSSGYRSASGQTGTLTSRSSHTTSSRPTLSRSHSSHPTPSHTSSHTSSHRSSHASLRSQSRTSSPPTSLPWTPSQVTSLSSYALSSTTSSQQTGNATSTGIPFVEFTGGALSYAQRKSMMLSVVWFVLGVSG
jgi:hypothetical protein